MGKEFEVKFLDIDENKVKKILLSINAKKVHSNIMFRRAVFHLCNQNIKGFARVRDEGKSITMTSKIYKDEKFPEENEVEIKGSFDDGCNFIKSLGLQLKAFQQSYREKWSHPLAHEITFDHIPGLPVYMEVDCKTEKNLNKLIELIGLDKSKMRYGAFDATYLEYYGIEKQIINDKTPSLTFANILNEIKPTKNQKLLENIYKSYEFKSDKYQIKKFNKTKN